MEYKHLGRSGLLVSRLCVGTGNFGTHTTEADSHRVLDTALAAGINFVDTADAYGTALGDGMSEQIIGRWFAQGGSRREKTVIATKVWGKMGEWANESKLSALHIRRACEESLRRLQTDHIDLYQMHHIDRETPWDEIWQALEMLVQQGKVIYVGSSNFAAWHLAQAQDAAKARHFLGIISEQSVYSLKHRLIELEVIPACQSYGIGLLPWSPLASGILGGSDYARASGGHRDSQRQIDARNKHRFQLDAYEAFCVEIGQKPAHVALAWLLHQPAVTAPVLGPRTVEQLQDTIRAFDVRLSDEHLRRLDAIWQSPGGAAPEAYYAW
jgi:aryl-alcohol dehydrogenase-like predicted oxidoreductase